MRGQPGVLIREGSGGRRIGARAKRTRMTTFRARGCRPVPRVPCTYLHVSAPALHGGGPVFELGILAVGALLVRDRLAQVGAHRSVTPCAFSCLVSAVAPAAKMSPAELTAERRSCLPRQPLRWVVARWNSHARLSLPFRLQRNLTPSVSHERRVWAPRVVCRRRSADPKQEIFDCRVNS